MLTNEPYPLYNRVALPRFLQGKVTEERVILRDRAWHDSRNIALKTGTMVLTVHSQERGVELINGESIYYDKLLVASGGWANPLQVPGTETAHNIYNFVTLDDSKTMIEKIHSSHTALAYGGGFISYELCDAFAACGLRTTWLMRSPYWLRKALDAEGGEVIDAIAHKFGVEVIHGDEIAEVQTRNGLATAITTKQGKTIETDMIGIGLGLSLNTSFLQDTSIEMQEGVLTDAYLQTSDPDICAAGDVAEFYDATIERQHALGTWDNALAHGRIAAINMSGGHEVYKDVPTYTSPLFDVNIAVIGTTDASNPEITTLTKRELGEKGTDNYRKLFFHKNTLVGVVLIGSPKGRKKLVELVRERQPFSSIADREAILDLK